MFAKFPKKLNDRVAIYVGCLLILLGLIVNKYTIGFYSDGYIESFLYNSIIATLELAIIACGIYFIVKKPVSSLNVALSVTVFLVGLFIAEVVSVSTGLFVPASFLDRRNYFHYFNEPDAELGFKVKPNLVNFKVSWSEEDVVALFNTDKYSFRNVGRNYSASRIYFIGDSFAFGHWLAREKTFFGIIESKLGEPVISLSAGGYGFRQYKILLNKFLQAYHPNVVVLCIYANDLEELPSESQLKDYYRYRGWDRYKEISYRQKSIFRQLVRITKQVLDYQSGRVQERAFENGIILYKFYGAAPDYIADSKYIEVEKTFLEIIELTRKDNAKLLVFLFPSKESVYKDEYNRLFKTDYLRNEEEGYARFCEIAEKNGIKCVDLTPLFRRWTSKGKRAYIDKGVHWNEFGNIIAADAILQHIIWQESRLR